MVLSKLNKLRLQKSLFRFKFLLLNMWLMAIRENHGPMVIWQKSLDIFFNGELSNEVKIKDVTRYLRKYVYGDFTDKKPYPKRPLLITQLYYIISIYRIRRLYHFFPIEYRVKTIKNTRKSDYTLERYAYRISHSIAKNGKDIKSKYYEEYKHIAKKYQWPIIFNSDDLEA